MNNMQINFYLPLEKFRFIRKSTTINNCQQKNCVSSTSNKCENPSYVRVLHFKTMLKAYNNESCTYKIQAPKVYY